MLYVVVYSWCEVEEAKLFLKLHTGSVLGRSFGTGFPIVSGTVVLSHAISGLLMNGKAMPSLKRGANGQLSTRRLHRFSTVSSSLFVVLTISTGLVSE